MSLSGLIAEFDRRDRRLLSALEREQYEMEAG